MWFLMVFVTLNTTNVAEVMTISIKMKSTLEN